MNSHLAFPVVFPTHMTDQELGDLIRATQPTSRSIVVPAEEPLEESEKPCVVCHERPRTVMLPCRHVLLCQHCAQNILCCGPSPCPTCRSEFTQFVANPMLRKQPSFVADALDEEMMDSAGPTEIVSFCEHPTALQGVRKGWAHPCYNHIQLLCVLLILLASIGLLYCSFHLQCNISSCTCSTDKLSQRGTPCMMHCACQNPNFCPGVVDVFGSQWQQTCEQDMPKNETIPLDWQCWERSCHGWPGSCERDSTFFLCLAAIFVLVLSFAGYVVVAVLMRCGCIRVLFEFGMISIIMLTLFSIWK